MKVSDSYMYDYYTDTLSKLKTQLEEAVTRVSSGLDVSSPSDSPVAYSQNLKVQTQLSQNEQYKSNLQSLQTTGSYYNTCLTSIGDIMTAITQLATEESSDTATSEARTTAASQVDSYIEQLVSLGNTKVGDTYIFGGKNSTSAPFSIAYDASGNITGVTFSGTTDVNKVAVNSTTSLKAGVSGSTIFTGTADGASVDIFSTLIQFATDLRNNDTTALTSDLDSINRCVGLTSANSASVGSYLSNISDLLNMNTTTTKTLTETSSNLVSADTVAALSDYVALQTAYQAAAYCMSKVEGLTVLKYM